MCFPNDVSLAEIMFRIVLPARLLATVVIYVVLVGCREAPPEFLPNQVRAMSLEKSRSVPTDAALLDVETVIGELFGSPAQPRWPEDLLSNDEQKALLSIERLNQAAGGVTSDRENAHTGLYQEHCVICHGVSGSGTGPASRFQVPYPRDFRAGIFKWKSTQRNGKPTREDLQDLLVRGIPGAPMPSFAVVPIGERDALVDYIIYLSIRGEVERDLLAAAIDDLDYDTTPPSEDLRLTLVSTSSTEDVGDTEGASMIRQILQTTVQAWLDAESTSVPPPSEGETADSAASITRGSEIFHGKIANCVGCHGPGGVGGLPTLDYDDWTKEFTTRIGITPADRDAVKPFRKAGALPPRKIDPRVLAGGVLRGGGDRETIYRRIQNGIAGTPMPSLDVGDEFGGKTGLTEAEAWDLVNYIESLVNEQ